MSADLAKEIVRAVLAIRREAGAAVDPETIARDAIAAYSQAIAAGVAARAGLGDDGNVTVTFDGIPQ